MKNFTMRTLIAAAALLAAAGMASAQTLKAEIPFTFRAAGAAMPAGSYEVFAMRVSNAVPMFRIAVGKKGVLMVAQTASDPSKEWRAEKSPKLLFECGAHDCSLIRAWTGEPGVPAYNFSHPDRGNEPTRLATITMKSQKTE